MLKLHLHTKAKAWVFANQVCSHFNGCGFTSHSKSWIQPHSDNVHHHLCFLSPVNCFKLVTCIQNLCESTTILIFSQRLKEEKIIHQKGLRTLYSLIFHSKTNKTLICIFSFYLKFQSSNFSMLGMKTRCWKFTYIPPVKIFQFCITTGSVSKCMLFIFRARGEDRWHSRAAEQNHGGVETGAIYGREDTSQVNNIYYSLVCGSF